MSRSYKKPHYTDQQRASDAVRSKRKANRAVRVTKDIASGKSYRKVSNSWDIRDYSFHCPELKKAYRK